jgi:protein SERAC1
MNGKPTALVNSASATHSRPWELEEHYVQPINRTHSDLVKFAKQDHDYEIIRGHLQRFSRISVDAVAKRFETEALRSRYL